MEQEAVDALKEYEQIKLQIKELEDRLAPLKEVILPVMNLEEKIETADGGTFELKSKSNWKFSADVDNAIAGVDAMKKEEIAKGIAINNPTVYLEYRKAK